MKPELIVTLKLPAKEQGGVGDIRWLDSNLILANTTAGLLGWDVNEDIMISNLGKIDEEWDVGGKILVNHYEENKDEFKLTSFSLPDGEILADRVVDIRTILNTPSVHPSGDKVACILYERGEERVHILDSRTLETISIINDEDYDHTIHEPVCTLFTPNGLLLAFNISEILCFDPDSLRMKWILERDEFDERQGDWNPDVSRFLKSSKQLVLSRENGNAMDYVNLANGRIVASSEGVALSLGSGGVFSDNGRFFARVVRTIVFGTNVFQMWKLPNFSPYWHFQGEAEKKPLSRDGVQFTENVPCSVGFDDTSSRMAIGYFAGTIRIFDLDEKRNLEKEEIENGLQFPQVTYLVICPFCGAKNQQGLLKCQKCGADI